MNNPLCPSCQQNHYVIKSGLNRVRTQRYRCLACQHYFTPHRKPTGYEQAVREQALKLYLEGTSLRAIGRLLRVNHQTVCNWIQEAADALPPQVADQADTPTIEVDELFTFVGQKKRRLRGDGSGS
jgi:transposase-like protein